jgi:rare lipoprotein A
MVQDILRSTLIVGAVLANAVLIGNTSHSVVSTGVTQPSSQAAVIPPPAPLKPTVHPVAKTSKMRSLRSGLATWYGNVRNLHRTASGEIFDATQLTAASNVLPFGTRVKVTNLRNHRSVVVRINDRGILALGHIIDLSSAAAEKIGLLRMGVAPVHVDVLAS